MLASRVGEVTIRYGKGGKQRTVDLNGQAVSVLNRWRCHRRDKNGLPEDSGPFFVTEANTRLAVRSIRHVIEQAAEASGVGLTPHVLRHTFGTRLARSGVDNFTIADLMGHASLDTTRQYARSNKSDRRAAVEHLTVDY